MAIEHIRDTLVSGHLIPTPYNGGAFLTINIMHSSSKINTLSMARGGSVGLDKPVVACNSMYSQPVKPSTASVCSK